MVTPPPPKKKLFKSIFKGIIYSSLKFNYVTHQIMIHFCKSNELNMPVIVVCLDVHVKVKILYVKGQDRGVM